MAQAVSNLLPELRVELPGIPVPILNTALFRVIRQFFWESEVWKYTYNNGLDWTLNQLALEVAVPVTDIPIKCVVKRVDTVSYSATGAAWDDIIPFKTRDQLDRENPNWYTETGSTPTAWSHGNNGAAIIIPQTTATVVDALLIRSVIAPVYTLVTDTLPDFLYYEFEDVIRAGILAQLMKQPGKDWSNPEMSIFYGQAFTAGMLKGKSRGQADFGQPKGTMAYGGI